MTERYGNPGGSFSASAIPGASSLPVDWEHPTQWSQLEKYFEPILKDATKKVFSMLMENSKSLEDFLSGTVYKVNGGSLYGNVSISGSLTVDGVAYYPFPVGSLMPFAASIVPTGWLLCDGTAYQQSQYPVLFGVISSTYNTHCGAAAPASGYFRVPNYSGRTIVGKSSSDSDFNDLTDYGGEKTHILTQSEMPSHNHQMDRTAYAEKKMESVYDSNVTYGAYEEATPWRTGNTGGSEAHNNLQPYAVANYIIKY